MPYLNKWLPIIEAIAHVMTVEKCDRHTAMQQMAGAVFDRELRVLRLHTDWSRWRPDGMVFRTDLLRLWPQAVAESAATETSDTKIVEKRKAYEERVAEFQANGKTPPI